MNASAAMLLWFDIVPEHVAEHDEWHTREHFPERVAIPGFLRAQRWIAEGSSGPRYLVTYDVEDIATLTSPAYEARLHNPTDWTRRMMPHYRGMVRGFCAVTQRVGTIVGGHMLSIRYDADPARRADLARWLAEECLPRIAQRRGFASACALVATVQPPMTSEQAIRGRDATVDSVVLVSSYRTDLLDALQRDELAAGALVSRGALPGIVYGSYRFACRADADS